MSDSTFWAVYSPIVATIALLTAISSHLWDRKKWKLSQSIELRCTATGWLNIGNKFNHQGLNMAQVEKLNYLSVHVNNTGLRTTTLQSISVEVFSNKGSFKRRITAFAFQLRLAKPQACSLPQELAPGQNWQGAFQHPEGFEEKIKDKFVRLAVYDNMSGGKPHYVAIHDGKALVSAVVDSGLFSFPTPET